MRGSISTHVMVYREDGTKVRVTRELWDEYLKAKRSKKRAPELVGKVFK